MKKRILLAPALGVVTAYMTFLPVRHTYAVSAPQNHAGRQWKAELRKELKNEYREYKEDVADIREKYKPLVINGKITQILETVLYVDFEGKKLTINIDKDTVFVRKFGGKSDLSEFSVGDTVNVRGMYTDEGKTTVLAKFIKDASIARRWGTFMGKVTSVGENKIVISTQKRGEISVTIDSETKILNKKGELLAYGDIKVGQEVVVSGVWNNQTRSVFDTNKLRVLSI